MRQNKNIFVCWDRNLGDGSFSCRSWTMSRRRSGDDGEMSAAVPGEMEIVVFIHLLTAEYVSQRIFGAHTLHLHYLCY